MRSSLASAAACARADLRRRRVDFVVLVVLLGLLGGALIAAVAGARRTDCAFDRMLGATDAGDAYVVMEACDDELPRQACYAASAAAMEDLRATTGVGDVVSVDQYVGI